MTLNKLVKEIAKRENKKVSVSVGNIREIVSIICDLEAEAIAEGITDGPVNLILEKSLTRVDKVIKKSNKTKG